MLTRGSLSLAVALGVPGGAVLILSQYFFTPGKFLLIPYAAVVLGTMLAIRNEGIVSFNDRFMTGLLAFVIYAGAHYVFLVMSPKTMSIGFLGHAWRLAFLIGVGVIINLAMARLSAHPARRIEATGT